MAAATFPNAFHVERIGYLGCAPLNTATKEVMFDAMKLLMLKLGKIQVKMVDRLVEKKHGSRLSAASPVYQKIASTLAKNGLDCTKGDAITVDINREFLSLTDIKTNSTNQIPLSQMIVLDILPSIEGNVGTGNGEEMENFAKGTVQWTMESFYKEESVIFAFVQDTKKQLLCHGLRCSPAQAEEFRAQLRGKLSALKPRMISSETNLQAPENSKITFGIGLHRKSSLRASKAQRQRSRMKDQTNLTGQSGIAIKFRPAGLGTTFASLGDTVDQPKSRPEVVKSPEVVDDDDLLDLDDDLFAMDDDLEDDEMNPNDLDLSGLNFD